MTREFELPWPPSVNHYYRHVGAKVLISRDGRKYREMIVSRFRSEGVETFRGPVELSIELYPPDNRRRDADNSLKCLLDAFTHGGLYEDDSLIRRLVVTKREPMPPDGMAYIRIREWTEDKTTGADAKSCRSS
ncbi:MAG: Crossover junction endodeoxyribonuclease RusA [Lentisphaerae bacterium ADurb.Bin242]|nr:MAG: Crossover junction endodeoxyribonuclease RusA [Lentisphaerae bacterium ADurb.Bin242]